MPHARVHVRLGALDVVVQVVAEVLDVADRRGGDVGLGEVPGEEDEGDVADVVRLDEVGEVPQLEGRVARGVEDLGRALDGGEAAGVDEFLGGWRKRSIRYVGWSERYGIRTWRKTFPKILSVSSLNTVEKCTVTRSKAAWM